MPRPSHFIPARMNGLIVGSRVVAACGLHGIMAAWHSAILTSVSPAAQPGGLAWKKAALCRGRESLPKAQVLPLEPCGTEPACVQVEMQHCCLSAPPAAQTPLHLLHKIRQKKPKLCLALCSTVTWTKHLSPQQAGDDTWVVSWWQ